MLICTKIIYISVFCKFISRKTLHLSSYFLMPPLQPLFFERFVE